MNKANELCALSEPWKITNHTSGGILMALTCGWSTVENCYHLVGKVYYDDGDQQDHQITTNVPSGKNILLPGEFFINCSGPFHFWYEYLTSKGILSSKGKTFRIDHVEYVVCCFHKNKCASRFKCDQCGLLVSSSQAYYDEGIGGTRCMKCEAILSGDIEVPNSLEAEAFQMIDKFDGFEF